MINSSAAGEAEDFDLLLEVVLCLSPLRNVHPATSSVCECTCACERVCGLFLFVCLSCVCLYCQTVMENVLGLLPHLVPKEI